MSPSRQLARKATIIQAPFARRCFSSISLTAHQPIARLPYTSTPLIASFRTRTAHGRRSYSQNGFSPRDSNGAPSRTLSQSALPLPFHQDRLSLNLPGNCAFPRFLNTSTNSASPQLTSSIAIIGAGDVGSTVAYSLIHNPVAGDVLLVDPAEEFCSAQAQDLGDATNFGSTATRIRTGSHEEAGQCDIIVMTAGAAQAQGESRTDLIGKNVKILKSALEDCKPFREDAILIVVANPVDVMTHFAQKFSELPRSQVFGSGTFLDTARLRGNLARQSGVAASSVDGYVLGEHGDSQFVAWSHASIGGIPLDEVVSEDLIDKNKIAEETKNAAAAIINAKGVTAFGVGGVAASLCKSVLFDERNIRPVSYWQDDLDVCLSMPAVIGREGIVRRIPIKLDERERRDLESSAESLKEVIQDADKNL